MNPNREEDDNNPDGGTETQQLYKHVCKDNDQQKATETRVYVYTG